MQKITIVISIVFIFLSNGLLAQKFLLLDNYNLKRVKLHIGDKIRFKIKGDKRIYTDYIGAIKDSSIYLGTTGQNIPLKEFSKFYFTRKIIASFSNKSFSVATGFLFASAIEPLVSNSLYDSKEAAVIGSSFFIASLMAKLFKWKVFNFKRENHRIRIMDTTFKYHMLNKKVSS